jgi:hypothetical protein
VTDDFEERLSNACNSPKKSEAWSLLPSDRSFTSAQAQKIVESRMKRSYFYDWWKELVRLGLVLPSGKDGHFVKAEPSRGPEMTGQPDRC